MKRNIIAVLVMSLLVAAGILTTAHSLPLATRVPGPTSTQSVMWSWQPDVPMITGRSGFGTLVADGYVLAFGGMTKEGLTAYGERAQIQPDGRLGRWIPSWDVRLPLPLTGFSVASHNSFIYLVGGNAGAGPLELVLHTRVVSGGFEYSNWTYTSLPLSSAWYARAVAVKGFLFVFDGRLGVGPGPPGASAGAQRATINADGSLGPWVDLGDLGIPTIGGAVSYGDWIYLLGGPLYHGSSAAVYRSRVSDDGSLSPPEAMARMNVPRDSLQSTVHGEAIYVVGGDNEWYGFPASFTAERAPILPDGSLSPWEMLPRFAVQRPGARLAATTSLYVLGGASTEALTTTERLWLAPYTQALPLILNGAVP